MVYIHATSLSQNQLSNFNLSDILTVESLPLHTQATNAYDIRSSMNVLENWDAVI